MKPKVKQPEPTELSSEKPQPYRLYAHPLFMNQLEELKEEVEGLQAKDPDNYHKKSASKRLAAITRLIFDIIPSDPARPEYRQGHTLGIGHTHWFRAKFFRQYRLFFRYDEISRVIVYAWVNDEHILRAYNSRTDVYAVFKAMLDDGHPPDSWAKLLGAAEGLTYPETEEQEEE